MKDENQSPLEGKEENKGTLAEQIWEEIGSTGKYSDAIRAMETYAVKRVNQVLNSRKSDNDGWIRKDELAESIKKAIEDIDDIGELTEQEKGYRVALTDILDNVQEGKPLTGEIK